MGTSEPTCPVEGPPAQDDLSTSSDEDEKFSGGWESFELSLSSFGTIWNFLNAAITDGLLCFLDARYADTILGEGTFPSPSEEQSQRSTVFNEQLGRVLPYVCQELGITNDTPGYSDLQVRASVAVQVVVLQEKISILLLTL